MKINRSVAVALMVAFGFSKAADWDNKKLSEKLAMAPEKVAEEDVPEEYQKVYKDLVAAEGQIEIVNDVKAPEAAEETEPAEKPKAKKKKPAEAAKPEKAEKPKAPAKPAKVATVVKKDAFGCREGTIAAKVNKVLGAKWKTEAEIMEEAGVTLDQARGRLYYAEVEGVIVREKLIRYRLVPKEEKKAA